MVGTGAHLSDHVLPLLPLRQWVRPPVHYGKLFTLALFGTSQD